MGWVGVVEGKCRQLYLNKKGRTEGRKEGVKVLKKNELSTGKCMFSESVMNKGDYNDFQTKEKKTT